MLNEMEVRRLGHVCYTVSTREVFTVASVVAVRVQSELGRHGAPQTDRLWLSPLPRSLMVLTLSLLTLQSRPHRAAGVTIMLQE